jgi:hypothetical protein
MSGKVHSLSQNANQITDTEVCNSTRICTLTLVLTYFGIILTEVPMLQPSRSRVRDPMR